MTRPLPPAAMLESPEPMFIPAQGVMSWAKETFIDEGGHLRNEDHEHLQQADIAFLWTNIENVTKGRRLLGTASLMPPGGDKWAAGRSAYQIREWFGDMPDFVITLDALAAMEMEHWQFCALVEHELYHLAQTTDQYGSPAFSKSTGKPLWGLRSHDVEEFVGVVRRYGATSPELSEMVRLVNKGPEIAATNIARACGTCLRLVK